MRGRPHPVFILERFWIAEVFLVDGRAATVFTEVFGRLDQLDEFACMGFVIFFFYQCAKRFIVGLGHYQSPFDKDDVVYRWVTTHRKR
jgi:hypothetical protein